MEPKDTLRDNTFLEALWVGGQGSRGKVLGKMCAFWTARKILAEGRMKLAAMPGGMERRLAETTQLLAEPRSKADTVRFFT